MEEAPILEAGGFKIKAPYLVRLFLLAPRLSNLRSSLLAKMGTQEMVKITFKIDHLT